MLSRQKKVRLNDVEEDVVIKSLNMARTERMQKNECDRDVSELMLKIMKSPSRKARSRNEAR